MGISIGMDILRDLNKSLTTEWLERNAQGVYASSTCIGMNTRREHGLFIVPEHTNKKKVLLLSKLEESVFINEHIYEISSNNYSGGIYPQGYKYIEKFDIDPYPRTTFNIDGRLLEKTIFLLSNQPVLVIRYELKNKGLPLSIIVKPFLTNRYNTSVTTEQKSLNTDSYQGYKFVRWSLKPNMPEIYVFHKTGEFISSGLWYKNFNYPNDAGKYPDIINEDLFNPGFFKVTLNSYESFDLFVSTKHLEIDHFNYHSIYRSEKEIRKEKKGFFLNEIEFLRISKSLSKTASRISEKHTISVSALENNYATRGILFSMPGLYLVNHKDFGFKELFFELTNQIKDGLLPVNCPYFEGENAYTDIDLSLWLIHFAYEYYILSNDLEFFKTGIYDSFLDIFDKLKKGTINNIYIDKDTLIFSGDKQVSTSWIPVLNETGEVLRYGKLLEINALWYNALNILAFLSKETGHNLKSNKFKKLAKRVGESFQKVFIQAEGKLADFVNNNQINMEFRVNQIIPLALPFSPLAADFQTELLKKIEKKLLTPYGLKASESHQENKVLNKKKSNSFYSSAVWPWTVHLFISAFLKLNKSKKSAAAELKDYFFPLVELINSGMIDNLPEYIKLQGEGSLMQNGIVDFAPSLSSVLWGYYQLNRTLKGE
jgi:predicted glycogen debranching enzyme